MEHIVTSLKEVYGFTNFKVCFIGIEKGLESTYKQTLESEFYDNWSLTINLSSFTGGLFGKPLDNENCINIIKNYDIDNVRVTKEEIDNYEF